MLILRRITTEYRVDEDRLRITAKAGDDIVVLWITHRLSNLLLPELFKWLEQRTTLKVIANQEVMQKSEQQDAMVIKQNEIATAPVKAYAATLKWLVTSVDITKQNKIMRLVFNDESKDLQAVMELNNTSMRQWLNAILIGYRKAQWPVKHWPDWIKLDNLTQKTKLSVH